MNLIHKWIDIDILTRMEHCTSMYNVIRCLHEWKAENQVEKKTNNIYSLSSTILLSPMSTFIHLLITSPSSAQSLVMFVCSLINFRLLAI